MAKKKKNMRAMRWMEDIDVGHDVGDAPEIRLRVYATYFKVRPGMRFVVGRVIAGPDGAPYIADEAPWTQHASYVEDVDPLKLYHAMVRIQADLAKYRMEWDRRKEAGEPGLSVFEMRDAAKVAS